jgi:hypothetical protein
MITRQNSLIRILLNYLQVSETFQAIIISTSRYLLNKIEYQKTLKDKYQIISWMDTLKFANWLFGNTQFQQLLMQLDEHLPKDLKELFDDILLNPYLDLITAAQLSRNPRAINTLTCFWNDVESLAITEEMSQFISFRLAVCEQILEHPIHNGYSITKLTNSLERASKVLSERDQFLKEIGTMQEFLDKNKALSIREFKGEWVNYLSQTPPIRNMDPISVSKDFRI